MREKYIFSLTLLFVSLTSLSGFCDEDCSYEFKSSVVQEMIDLIKFRLNVLSLKCSYTSIIPQKDIPPAEFDFIYQDGNYVRSRVRIDTEEPEKPKEVDTPQNLLEFLAQKAQPHHKKQPNLTIDYVYHYNGEFYTRFYPYDFDDKEIIRIGRDMRFDGSGPRPDTRLILGYFGRCLDSNNGKGPFRRIPEFLDYPGPYDYSEKDGYRILWHRAIYHDLPIEAEGTDTEDVDLEIWIDSKGYIVKVQEGAFWTRRYGYDYVKRVLGEGYDITCDFPADIWRIYEFHDIQELNNGAQLPLKCASFRTGNSRLDPCFKEIQDEYKSGKISEEDASIKISAICEKRTVLLGEVIIHPEGLLTNEPIAEETFIPPKLSLERRFNTFEEYKKYSESKRTSTPRQKIGETFNIPAKALVFVGVGVLIVLVLMYLTHRYLGWSFF